MLLIHKIEKTHFSSSETIIIDYILGHPQEIKNMTVHEIAVQTYTSGSLVIRIAKKLGYSGWNELKEDFIKELNYLYDMSEIDASIPFVVDDHYMEIANNISKLEIETIQDTMNLLKHDILYSCMRILRKAEIIDIYSVSQNIYLAECFAEKMFTIQKQVNVCKLIGKSGIQASMCNDKHCAILISYSGQTHDIIETAKILNKKKIPMIALTSIGENELSKLSDVTVYISSREMLHTKIGEFATSQSIQCILDILYSCIFSLDYQNNLDRKIEIAKEIDDRISGYEYIDEKD